MADLCCPSYQLTTPLSSQYIRGLLSFHCSPELLLNSRIDHGVMALTKSTAVCFQPLWSMLSMNTWCLLVERVKHVGGLCISGVDYLFLGRWRSGRRSLTQLPSLTCYTSDVWWKKHGVRSIDYAALPFTLTHHGSNYIPSFVYSKCKYWSASTIYKTRLRFLRA